MKRHPPRDSFRFPVRLLHEPSTGPNAVTTPRGGSPTPRRPPLGWHLPGPGVADKEWLIKQSKDLLDIIKAVQRPRGGSSGAGSDAGNYETRGSDRAPDRFYQENVVGEKQNRWCAPAQSQPTLNKGP